MEEDDMDFIPSQNTSSNLASLFGFTKKPLQGNSSLTYTAPKAPKGESSLAKKIPEEKTKSKIIFSKAVHAYKLENRTYIGQGLIGIVISGNHDSQIYEIILYKRNKEHLCQIRISSSFLITLSPNNYVSFYDNNKQNWSLMFQSPADAEQFSQKVAICKFYSHSEKLTEALIQDMTPMSQPKATINSTVDVIYSSYALIPEEISKLKEDVREQIKLSSYDFLHLSKNLVGCSENCKRVIIIPHSLGGPWLNELNPHKDLLLEVKLERLVPEFEGSASESKPSKEGHESPVDSSAEETSVKAKGASIKEALSSTKSQKANLISRMARMGQATLPLKPGLSAGQSDSEEENMLVSSPKLRIPRNRVTSSSPTVNSSLSQTSHSAEPSQQLSLYQNDLSWHQSQLNKPGVVYQQLIPVSASPMTSPTTDPSLSVYLSESRVQAAELRMGISKVSEKLDLIWNKMQNTVGECLDSKRHQLALLDSEGILASVQNLIKEKESLKEKVEEQRGKIEQQNDKIFHLLELNQKYLEQNSTTHDKQSQSESKLKTEIESLQKNELEYQRTHKKMLEKMRDLIDDLYDKDLMKKELMNRIETMTQEAENFKKNVEKSNDSKKKEFDDLKEKFSKASYTIIKMEERLKEITSENENLKSVIETQKEEIETGNSVMKDSETKNKEYEKAVESLKKQISDEEMKTESKIDDLSKIVAKLEEENKCLMEKIEKQDNKAAINSILSQVLSKVRDHFSNSKQYLGSEILTAIDRILNNVTDGTAEPEEKSDAPGAKYNVVPAPRKSRQNLESWEKQKETEEKEKEAIKEENKAVKEENKAVKEENKAVKEENKAVKKENEAVKKEKELIKEEKEAMKKETSESCLSVESVGKKEVKNETDDEKKKEETDSRYKSYDQGWRTTKPPPPPLFDDEDDVDDWLN